MTVHLRSFCYSARKAAPYCANTSTTHTNGRRLYICIWTLFLRLLVGFWSFPLPTAGESSLLKFWKLQRRAAAQRVMAGSFFILKFNGAARPTGAKVCLTITGGRVLPRRDEGRTTCDKKRCWFVKDITATWPQPPLSLSRHERLHIYQAKRCTIHEKALFFVTATAIVIIQCDHMYRI